MDEENKDLKGKNKIVEVVTNTKVIIVFLIASLVASLLFNFLLIRESSKREHISQEIEVALNESKEDAFSEKEAEEVDSIAETILWLESELDGFFTIGYNSDIHAITFLMEGQGIVNDFNLTLRGSMPSSAWDELFETMTEFSVTVSERAGDESLSVILLNPVDTNGGLFGAQNGKEIYNAFKEIGL